MTLPALTPAEQIVATIITCTISAWVVRDALRRGRRPAESFLWGFGVLMIMIVCLPAYFIYRNYYMVEGNPSAACAHCRYCSFALHGDPIYCPSCSKQLKGAESVHGKHGKL